MEKIKALSVTDLKSFIEKNKIKANVLVSDVNCRDIENLLLGKNGSGFIVVLLESFKDKVGHWIAIKTPSLLYFDPLAMTKSELLENFSFPSQVLDQMDLYNKNMKLQDDNWNTCGYWVELFIKNYSENNDKLLKFFINICSQTHDTILAVNFYLGTRPTLPSI